jgi:hypothetical protein
MFRCRAMAAVAALIVVAPPVQGQEQAEPCGVVHRQTRQPLEGQRFWPLAEHRGKAFVDRKTCLVASSEVRSEPVTIGEAMEHCSSLGQGGPRGEMGWQLPTMAELTGLDGEEWAGRSGLPQDLELPPETRSETAYWTVTEWPGASGSYATVIFSNRTTIVSHQAATAKAAVWCVQGTRATSIK